MDNHNLLKRLAPPAKDKVLQVVIDTDTYNEVDDQFAVAYALLSPERMKVQAIYAAPFLNKRSKSSGHGMELSYQEILNILDVMQIPSSGWVFKGSEQTVTEKGGAVDSPAARDLIERAMSISLDDDPLYVIAIGAISNVASAMMLEPKIRERISVVWMGANARYWKNAKEFNCCGDIMATRYLFDCGVPLTVVPAMASSSHMLTTIYDLEYYLKGKSALCDLLVDRFRNYTDDHYGWSKEIWDVAAIAYLIDPDWHETELVPSPAITDHYKWEPEDHSRHRIRMSNFLNRNAIFRDMYQKLSEFQQ